jgi:hypothetical protein
LQRPRQQDHNTAQRPGLRRTTPQQPHHLERHEPSHRVSDRFRLDPSGSRRRHICQRSAKRINTKPYSAEPEPRRQRVIARRRGRERPHTQQAADRIDRSRDMHIQMRVHTPDYRTRNFYDGHLPSLLSQTVKGWHARPGKETVTINLFVQEDRSPSGTGRAQFQTQALFNARAQPERTGHHQHDGGPQTCPRPSSLAVLCAMRSLPIANRPRVCPYRRRPALL